MRHTRRERAIRRASRRVRIGSIMLAAALAVLAAGGGVGLADPPAEPPQPPSFTSKPTLDNLRAGSEAAVDTSGAVGDATLSFGCQWEQAGSGTSPGVWGEISGATSCSAYTVPTGYDKYWLRARVTATNTAGSVTVRSYAYRVGGEMVYSHNPGDGKSYVKAAFPDGSSVRQITPTGVAWSSRHPALSPDGTRIAFSSNKDPNAANGTKSDFGVWVMDVDGTNIRLVADNGGNDDTPAWSADGSRIVFANGNAIYTVNADGSDKLLFFTSNTEPWPVFTPDGAGVLFVQYSGYQIAQVTPWNGSYPRKYFRVVAAVGTCPGAATIGYYPPGGATSSCIPEYLLYTRALTGGSPTAITSTPTPADNDSTAWGNLAKGLSSPRYSPDGDEIVTHAVRNSGGLGNTDRVKVLPATGGDVTLAGAISASPVSEAAWSPEGARVLYHANPGGSGNSYVANSDGTGVATVWNVTADSDWGVLASLPTPSLPLEQTFGSDVADNPGDEAEVNSGTGAFSTAVTDIALAGIDVPFAWSRSYSSRDATVGDLGPGWQHSFAAKLTINGTSGDVTVRAGDGQQLLFVKQADGTHLPTAGATSKLVKNVGGDYELTLESLEVYAFDAGGRLSEIRTPNARELVLAYDGAGKLDAVTDTVGRVIDVTWNGANTRITRVALADGRDVEYGYDASNRLQTVTDLRGKVWTYGYDGTSSRLYSIKDPRDNFVVRNTYVSDRVTNQLDAKGKQTAWSWNTSTQTATITDPASKVWKDVYKNNVLLQRLDPLGKETSFRYDEDLSLTRVLRPLGATTAMVYDLQRNMIGQQPLGQPASAHSYNTSRQVTSETDARGYTTAYEYDTRGNLTKTTAPGDRVREWTLNTDGLPTQLQDARGKTWTYTYDTQGNTLSETSPLGNKTTWAYDAYGRMTSTVRPRGNCSGCTAANYTRSFTYDAGNLRLTETDELGRVTTSTYDNAGNLATVTNALNKTWTYAHDELNRRIRETAPNNAITEVSYDDRGNVTEEKTAEGFKATHGYDDANRRIWTVSPRGNVAGGTPNDHKTLFAYDADGNLTGQTDPLGNQLTHTYDAQDRLTKTVYTHTDLGTTPASRTLAEYTYDANRNVTSVKNADGTTVTAAYDELSQPVSRTDERGKTTTFAYDKNGNQLEQVTPLGFKTTWAYDDDNRRSSMVTARGNISGGTPADYTWSYTYDADGNLTGQTDPLANQTAWAYDRVGRKTSATDANNHTTSWESDELGRLTKVIDPRSKQTLYGYDDVSNLTSRTDAKNHVTTYGYDLDKRLTSLVKPGPTTGTRTWSYTYDAESNRTKLIDANGNATASPTTDGTTQWTYDRLGRVSAVDYSDSTPDVAFTYDAWGNRASMVDGQVSSETYSHDVLNRLTGASRGSDTFGYEYDAAGNVTKRTYPDATAVEHSYDDDGRMNTVKVGGSTVASYGYNQEGLHTSTTLPAANGYVETRLYDKAGRLSEVKHAKAAVDLSKFTYTRDGVGNPTQIAKLGGALEKYFYDEVDRLTEVCYQAACTGASDPFVRWTYDDVGNRLTEARPAGTTAYTYDNADQLTSETAGSTTNYTYDENGNQLSKGSRTLTWDLADRLKTTTAGGSTISYAYDGAGKRLSETDGTNTTRFLWDRNAPLPELALERNGAGGLLRRYHHGLGPVSMRNGVGEDFYYHPDGLGSIANLTNATGVTQWTYEYEPFGGERVATPASGAPVNRMRYTGQYLDVDTGLYHLRARQYDPANGRFLATDPVPQEITDPYVATYVYVNQRPTVLVDPSGLSGCGRLSFACDAARGVADELYETGKGAAQFGLALTNPAYAQTYWREQASAFVRDYRAQGGGLWGFADAANMRNPGFRYLVAQSECRGAVGRRASSRAVGKACAAAALRAAELGLVAVGGAKAFGTARTGMRDAHAAKSVPEVVFSRSKAPGLAQNFDDAVAAGKPSTLNRVATNAQRDANRRAALRGERPAPAGQSLDEYPFACTTQGGAGACVRAVPHGEQNYQGGVLSRFFQANNIGPNDPFRVRFGP